VLKTKPSLCLRLQPEKQQRSRSPSLHLLVLAASDFSVPAAAARLSTTAGCTRYPHSLFRRRPLHPSRRKSIAKRWQYAYCPSLPTHMYSSQSLLSVLLLFRVACSRLLLPVLPLSFAACVLPLLPVLPPLPADCAPLHSMPGQQRHMPLPVAIKHLPSRLLP